MAEVDKSDSNSIRLFKPSELPKSKRLSAKGINAQRVINKYSFMASGIGFVPSPILGQIAVGGILVKLLQDLCRIYGISLSDHKIKVIVASVLGGAHSEWIGYYLMKYIKNYSPALVPAGSYFLRPAISGLIVYYIGKLFLGHLESGAWVRIKEKGIRQFG
ncbi:MAG: hypothetical protein ACPW60_10760 [Methylohalobius sp. ZOD2]|nr:hypothetical protein [Methylothermaceae bacterium]